jgi:RNA recognition motif-containing protein
LPHCFLPPGLGLDPFFVEIGGLDAARVLAQQIEPLDCPGEIESRSIVLPPDPDLTPDRIRDLSSSFGDIAQISGYVVRFFDLRSARTMRACTIVVNCRLLALRFGPSLPVLDARKPPNNGTVAVFHLPAGVRAEDLAAEFGKFGQIRQIRQTPHRSSQRFVEFWDSRDADVAIREANGRWMIGARIAVEFSLPGGWTREHRTPTVERAAAKARVAFSAPSYA